ncbi:MAG: fimbrial protein [Nitratireductor sp.]|uniref:fimbrial protein n=1 Tax=Nitratireductor sp. B36 TaxID=2762059 RepID=UPI000C9328ED|nr:fimbrial protein [Nitratireductor sp. B36]MAS15653.1 fimbrial protein [Nitratireductor sp.]MCC5780242.1 fimbrial protein [Nitratireductor sp. B36]
MATPQEQEDLEQEELDPAAERVRRKMVRFMAINLGILFAAVMAVVLAFVYKTLSSAPEEPAATIALPGDAVEGRIDLPQGARILSQSLDGVRVSLHLRLADGAEELRLFDLTSGQMIARFVLEP